MAIKLTDIEPPKKVAAKAAASVVRTVEPIGPLKRGRKTDANSERQTKPWLALKISERTFYRMRKKGEMK